MSRSLKKGPYVDARILKKVNKQKPGDGPIKIWQRASEISPEMIGYTFLVHNGKNFIEVRIGEEMVGYHFGEFAPTRKFVKHGGKMQRELEQKAAVAATEATKAATEPKK